jgi:penicillin amidase
MLGRFGVAAGATGALIAGGLGYLLRRPLPLLDGEIKLSGLTAPVEVIRDRWGIPHISARDPHTAAGERSARGGVWQGRPGR